MIMQLLFAYVFSGVITAIYASHDNRFFKVMFPSAFDYLKLVMSWPYTMYIIVKEWGKE